MDLISCDEYNNQINQAIQTGVIVQIIIYGVFLIFNLNSIRQVYGCNYITNKTAVKQTYLCIMMTLLTRIICGLFFILWRYYELNDQSTKGSGIDMVLTRTGIFQFLHALFNMLPISSLLFLISVTTYQWFLGIIKNEYYFYLDRGNPEQQQNLKDNLKKIKIFFIVMNIAFFISNIAYIFCHLNYAKIIILSEFLFQSLTLGVVGYKIYEKNENKQWFLKYLIISCVLLLGRSIHTLVQLIYLIYFQQTEYQKCYNHSKNEAQYMMTLEDYVFSGKSDSVVHSDYLLIYYLSYYIPFELMPCLIFQFIIQPNKEKWFCKTYDQVTSSVGSDPDQLFSSLVQQ